MSKIKSSNLSSPGLEAKRNIEILIYEETRIMIVEAHSKRGNKKDGGEGAEDGEENDESRYLSSEDDSNSEDDNKNDE